MSYIHVVMDIGVHIPQEHNSNGFLMSFRDGGSMLLGQYSNVQLYVLRMIGLGTVACMHIATEVSVSCV